MNYYNEFDRHAAAWLRELIKAKLIPAGEVDERSIVDVKPHELTRFTQCHFFAGIGGWSEALRLAKFPADRHVWTASCPCQPFSTAGKGLGNADARHLWPVFFDLLKECRPHLVIGEQVASAIRKGWLDGISADLEGENYTCGHVVLGAHSAGAPHIRQRLFWVAYSASARCSWEIGRPEGEARDQARMLVPGADRKDSGLAIADRAGREPGQSSAATAGHGCSTEPDGGVGGVGDTKQQGLQGHAGNVHDGNQPGREHAGEAGPATETGGVGGLGHAGCQCDESGRGAGDLGCAADQEQGQAQERERIGDANSDSSPDRAWSDYELVPCRDGKSRRIESGSQPLVTSIPCGVVPGGDPSEQEAQSSGEARVMRLKGYGNSICVETAAEFIRACLNP